MLRDMTRDSYKMSSQESDTKLIDVIKHTTASHAMLHAMHAKHGMQGCMMRDATNGMIQGVPTAELTSIQGARVTHMHTVPCLCHARATPITSIIASHLINT